VDCQIIIHTKNGEDVSVAGKCEVEVFDIVHGKQISTKLLIRPQQVKRHWTLVGWDSKGRIAIYVNEHIGAE